MEPDEGNSGRRHAGLVDNIRFHVENSPLGVVEWDSEFRVCFWSGRAQETFGWSEKEVLGKHPDEWKFVHESDADDVAAVMDELISGRAPRNISMNRNYTRDGRVIHCEWYNSVLTDSQGNLVSILSLIHDVSDRIAAEEQLRQLQKMESVGQLTGGIAHDFNNMLTVIMGNASLLIESLDDRPEIRVLADTIISAAGKGADLTNQLLSFARRQPLEPRAVNVGELLEGMVPLLTRTLEEWVSLSLVSRSKWLAHADSHQLESTLLNLCLNARDAMTEAGRLTIESEDVILDEGYAKAVGDIEPGEYVMVVVSDTGTGIDPEHLHRIFEPFFTTKPKGHGTGLGLSMVYGFVKQSSGHIKVYSESGSGTTVRIYLPRYSGAVEELDPEPEPLVRPGRGERILVVEDDELVREYAVGQLTRMGYRPMSASTGEQALELLEQDESIDLLFTDVVMPGNINGPRLVELARAKNPSLKVLYTSGYTENAIIHHGRLDPGIVLLSKPYRRETLAWKLQQALNSEEPGEQG